jgi:hypothetical protein
MADQPLTTAINGIFGKQSKQLGQFANLTEIAGKDVAKAIVKGSVDASTGLGFVLEAVDFFFALFSSDPDPNAAVLAELRSEFLRLAIEQRAENIITRINNGITLLGPAQEVGRKIKSLLKAQPPPTEVERLNEIGVCQQSLHQLQEDNLWTAPFNDQIFYSDGGKYMWPVLDPGVPVPGPNPQPPPPFPIPVDRGYGAQAPQPDGTGRVFNYFYVLLAYQESMFLLQATVTALLPDFPQRFPEFIDDLRRAADSMQQRHDQIVGGIIALSPLGPGPWDQGKLLDALSHVFLGQFAKGITPLTPLQSLNLSVFSVGLPVLPILLPLLGGVNIEYGAVEKFSGASSMGDYKLTFQQIGAMQPSDTSVFNKFKLRLEKKQKDVYILVGLTDILRTINAFRTMLGDAPVPRPGFGDWSIRAMMTTAQVQRRADGFHVRDLIKFIRETPPDDTPKLLQSSFRSLLV